eukprot:1472694-Rhodomonas_salina.2
MLLPDAPLSLSTSESPTAVASGQVCDPPPPQIKCEKTRSWSKLLFLYLAIPGTDCAYHATRTQPPLLGSPLPILLRACYAMSGTDVGYAATAYLPIWLRTCHAMSGTDVGYAATRS